MCRDSQTAGNENTPYFHLFPTCTRAYNRPTQQPAPGWHDSSTSRALHWHRRGQGFESRSGLNFSGLPRYCISSVTKKTRLRGSHTSNFQCFNYIVIKLVSICCRSLCLPWQCNHKVLNPHNLEEPPFPFARPPGHAWSTKLMWCLRRDYMSLFSFVFILACFRKLDWVAKV